jgi:DNA-binding MarR family transcriptional regulator
MPKPIPSNQRRALRLLADNGQDGMTEGLLILHGIPVETLAELIKAGLATAHVERSGRPQTERRVLVITDAGREAIGNSVERAGGVSV